MNRLPVILLLLVSNVLIAQKIQFPYSYKNEFQEIHEDDKVIKILDSNLKFIEYFNPDFHEFFTPSDTAYRDYFVSGENVYIIDSLVITNHNSYSMNSQIEGVYKTRINGEKFIIVDFYDGFQLGTMVQPLYFIFKEEKGSFALQSVYIIENVNAYDSVVTESLQMFYENGKIKMKGINLVLLRDPNWLTLQIHNALFEGIVTKDSRHSLFSLLGQPEEITDVSRYQTDCKEWLKYKKKGLTYHVCGDTAYLQGIYFPQNPDVKIIYNGETIDGKMTIDDFCRKFNINKEYVFSFLFVNTPCPFVDEGFASVIMLYINGIYSECIFDSNQRLVYIGFPTL